MFDSESSRKHGSKGGRASTNAKRIAARVNGKKGGRPPSRTFVEKLLQHEIPAHHQKFIAKAYDRLFESEKQTLSLYFGVDFLNSLCAKLPTRLPEEIRYLLSRFKLAAKYHLRNAKPAKPYSVEWRQPSDAMRENWEMRFGDLNVPCPPRKVKVDVRYLPDFNYIATEFTKNPRLTARDVKDIGGGKWTIERAHVAIAYLKSLHPAD
jgi:hypothetical protein